MSFEKKKSKVASGRIAERFRLSLVFKLGWRSFFFLMRTFLLLDFLLFFVLCLAQIGFIQQKLETVAEWVQTQTGQEISFFDPSIVWYREEVQLQNEGYGKKAMPDGRAFFAGEGGADQTYFFVYPLHFSKGDISSFNQCGIAIPFGKGFLVYWLIHPVKEMGALFLSFFAIEFILLLLSIPIYRKKVQKTLRPIHYLAQVAHDLNGYDLDARLSIPGTQNELVDLAAEINGLLDRIQEAGSVQGRFVSDASHELRTPIAVIQGYADLLDRWGKDDPTTLNESIHAIQKETRSMQSLVEQLLFLARGDNNATKFSILPFEVSTMMKEVYEESQLVDDKHHFLLGPLEPAWMEGDLQLMKQLVRIFLDNARKYTPDDGKIYLSCQVAPGEVTLTVEDEGFGIKPEELPHIFERFYRANKARSRKGGSSGLGLAIADQILRLHDGRVEVISRENIGTRVRMMFKTVAPPMDLSL